MQSNAQRTKQQLTIIPVTAAAMAAVLWPVSYMAAHATGWLTASGSTFADIWFGAAAIVTFIGACAATIGFVITTFDSLWTWFRD